MIAERGLGQAQRLIEVTDALFPALQKLQYPQALFIAERLEYPCVFNIRGCHDTSLSSNQVKLMDGLYPPIKALSTGN
jgi:hypothetical protein